MGKASLWWNTSLVLAGIAGTNLIHVLTQEAASLESAVAMGAGAICLLIVHFVKHGPD